MKKREVITLHGEEVEVSELTVHDVRTLFQRMESRRLEDTDGIIFVLSVVIDSPIPPEALQLSAPAMTEERLFAATPGELKMLYDKVAELNPFLSRLGEKMRREPASAT